MPTATAHGNPDRAARMRAALLRLVIGVVVVDALGFATFYFTALSRTPNGRMSLGLVWLLATLAVVLPGLRGVRAARRS
ncbi:MAG: hypothetical protein ABJC19_03585 [Gemmatimonadota bacterium]